MTKPNEITVPTFMCELDSHADTCCLGRGCHVLYQTDTADVSGFTETLGNLNETPVITGSLPMMTLRAEQPSCSTSTKR